MNEKQDVLVSPNRYKEFVVTGPFVEIRDRQEGPLPEESKENEGKGKKVLHPPEIFTIEEVARKPIDGIDTTKVLSEMADMGPEA